MKAVSLPQTDGSVYEMQPADAVRRLVDRASRLARLVEMGAPAVIIGNEVRLVEDAADWVSDAFADELKAHRRNPW